MICPNCGSNISDKRKRCDRCGTDLTVYRKILRSSNLFYNNGLARARVRDLSGAVIALRKSLELNKLNTNARNLLGLIYFEMGETVAALSEWVISRHFQPTGNDAEEYISKVQSNPTRLDTLNQAIKRYNTALNFAKQGSDDLAVIQLKKVITLNPHFIRAYQLLALIHMKAGDNEKARRHLVRAGRIDVSNTLTLRYMQELEAPDSKDMDANPEAAAEQNTVPSAIMPISTYKEDKPNIMAFINLVLGVVIGIAVMAILIIPSIKHKEATGGDTNYSDNASLVSQVHDKENTIKTLQSDKDKLNEELKKLQTQIDSTASQEDITTVYETLDAAVGQYLTELAKPASQRDYTALADTLAGLDDSKFKSDSSLSLIKTLRDTAYPEAAKLHYDKGHNLYSKAKYEEALTELEKAMTFDPKDVDAVYFTARAYDQMGDKQNAATYYNKVINDFSDSSRVTYAKSFLKQVQGQ